MSRRSQAGLDPATAVPGEPLPADYDGVRLTRRFKVRPGLEMRLDGYPTTLVDLSRTGAQVLVPKPLRFNQAVRISITDEEGAFRFRATVVWAAFERSVDTGEQWYRAGTRVRGTRMPNSSTSCASAIAWSNRSHRRAGYR